MMSCVAGFAMCRWFSRHVWIRILIGLTAMLGCASPAGTLNPTVTALDLNLIVSVGDIAVGEQRFVFTVLDNNRVAMRLPQMDYRLMFVDQNGTNGMTSVLRQEGIAIFRSWPGGTGGVYTARLDFDRAGTWALEVSGSSDREGVLMARTLFTVKQESSSIGVGAKALHSKSKTIRDVGGRVADLEQITSTVPPDPDLYQVTIAEALEMGKPLLVYFGTPAFCATSTCGPQYDVIADLKGKYKDRVNFIHVEIWDNPLDVRENSMAGKVSLVVEEWGLISEPMTYVVDGKGAVFDKFEAFISAEELDVAITEVLAMSSA